MKAMTVIEIVHTHPFAAGIAVGIILAFGSLVLCTAFLFSLEKMKAISRDHADNAKAESENPGRPLFSESSVGSPDSGSVR
jgi:hypothetical protein